MSKQTAKEAYDENIAKAAANAQTVLDLIHDMPAPESEEFQPHWGHVGDVVEINRRLAAVVAFLNHEES